MDTSSPFIIGSLHICISWLQSTFKAAMFSKMQVLRLSFCSFLNTVFFPMFCLMTSHSLSSLQATPEVDFVSDSQFITGVSWCFLSYVNIFLHLPECCLGGKNNSDDNTFFFFPLKQN